MHINGPLNVAAPKHRWRMAGSGHILLPCSRIPSSRPTVLAEFPPSRPGYAQHGDYPNGSDAVRYLGNGGPACSRAPECRPLPERRPSLTPRVWSPKSHLKTARPQRDNNTIGKYLQVFVRDNNVEQALRALKRKMQREGVFREMKRRKAYEKPSERRTREKAEAMRRVRKAARKQAQRDGLIPMPKRREDARRSVARPRSF